MKPLYTIKRILIWIYMCKPERKASKWTKTIYFKVGLTTFAFNLGALAAHFAYIYTFLSTDLEASLFACFGIFGFFGVTYVMMSAFFLQEKINSIFEKLSRIYEMCKFYLYSIQHGFAKFSGFIPSFNWLMFLFSGKNTDINRFLIEANETSEWICTTLLKFMFAYFANVATMSILSVFFCWLSEENLDVNEFYHPLNMM